MSGTKLNKQLNEAIVAATGRRYCRTGSHEAPAEGGRQRKGKPWECAVCVKKAAARRVGSSAEVSP